MTGNSTRVWLSCMWWGWDVSKLPLAEPKFGCQSTAPESQNTTAQRQLMSPLPLKIMKSPIYWVVPCTKHCVKGFININFIGFSKQPQWVAIDSHILKMREQRLKEVESCPNITWLIRAEMKIPIRYMYFSRLYFFSLHATMSIHKQVNDSHKTYLEPRLELGILVLGLCP